MHTIVGEISIVDGELRPAGVVYQLKATRHHGAAAAARICYEKVSKEPSE
jgi:hypothetical protein